MFLRTLNSGRIGALAGMAFAFLLFFSTAMVDMPRSETDAELIDWWSDGGNLTSVLVSTYLQIGAGICFLAFISALRVASPAAPSVLSNLAFASSLLFVALLFASDGPRGVIAHGVKVGDEELPGTDFLRYMPQLGYLLLGTIGGIVVGVSIGATSAHILRTGTFARWVGILGAVLAVACIALAAAVGPFFIPVLLVWVLSMSFALWRWHPTAASEAAHAAPLAAPQTARS